MCVCVCVCVCVCDLHWLTQPVGECLILFHEHPGHPTHLSKANGLNHGFSCKCYAGWYLNGLDRKNVLPALCCPVACVRLIDSSPSSI